MRLSLDQSTYWNKVAHQKEFNHPLDWELFAELISFDQLILDFGCGYGRIINKLKAIGYRQLVGIDSSEEMIRRARQQNPDVEWMVNKSSSVPFVEDSVDAVILFAVLTCIPNNQDQQRLIAELYRILKPNGILYISDLLLNQDTRNQNRYNQYAPIYGEYGIFELSEGGVFRHHSWTWINDLFSDFQLKHNREMNFVTMNGNPSKGFQLILRKPNH